MAADVRQAAAAMGESGQYPATVVGATAPNGQTAIGVSGPTPSTVAPNLEAAAEPLGGVGAKNAGNVVGCCGKFHAANELMIANPGLQATEIIFTPAIRPRTMEVIPPCANCKTMFNLK